MRVGRNPGSVQATDADWRALAKLVELTRGGAGVRPGYFGQMLWGERRTGSGCSAPYARQAGKVLGRLAADGFADWRSEGTETKFWRYWYPTPAGKAALEEKRRADLAKTLREGSHGPDCECSGRCMPGNF